MFSKETQAIYVELADSGGRKRYLLPNELTTLGKLKALLTKYPQISLVRNGFAKVTSDPDKSELDSIMEIEHIPVKVNALYRVHMPDHPDIVDNFARYSEDLINLIAEESEVNEMQIVTSNPVSLTESLKAQVNSPEVSFPSASVAPGASLTDSLKAQVDAKREATRNRPQAPAAHVESSSAPWVDQLPRKLASVMSEQTDEELALDHEEYVERHLEEQYEILLQVVDQISSINEKVDAIGVRMYAPEVGETLTGEQLEKWFSEAAAKVGFAQAFEILALRIQGENPEI